MKKLNILFLSSWYPNEKSPTLGNFVQRHAQAVATQHNIFVLFATSLPDLKKPFSIEKNQEGNLTEVIVYYKNPLTKIEKLLFVYKALQLGFNEISKTCKLDLVHLNVIRPLGFFALYLKWFYNLKYIITEHWTGFLPENNYFETLGLFERKLIQITGKKAEKICPVSDNLGQNMGLKGLANYYVSIPNVVDFEVFHPQEITRNYFLHVSHLKQNHKNIFGILEAFEKFARERKDVQLKIVGDEEILHVQEKIKSLGIEGKVEILGAQQSEDIAKLMQGCLAFILFSNYENLPCVLEEAQACGSRIISTNVGGIEEHFKHDKENVFLLKPNDVDKLAEGLEIFYQKPYSFENKKLRSEMARQKFSVEAIASQYNLVYQTVV